MVIRLNDPAPVDDLCAHFRRSGFTAESVGGGMVEVTRSEARTPVKERNEIRMHLRVWETMNPTADAVML